MSTRLTDEDFLRFLTDGYIVVQPTSLNDDFHKLLWQRADQLYDRARKLESPTAHLEILGDNLRALAPEVDELLSDPAIEGAVTSILGDDAHLHPHNYVHESTLKDQAFHQDGNLPWNERGHYRSHRPDWLILFYYPQDVTADNGPTEIIPCSQYWTTDIERADGTWRPGDPIDPDLDAKVLKADDLKTRDKALAASLRKLGIADLQRQFIEVPRGSVVIANYDLIHRGTRKLPSAAARYMFKFYFARTHEPTEPTWHCAGNSPTLDHVRKDLRPIVESNWVWSCGGRLHRAIGAAAVDQAINEICTGGESAKVAAGYQLGIDTGSRSLEGLLTALSHQSESTRRAAAYGLRLRSDEARDALTDASRDERVSVRRFATFALGASWSQAADSLIERLEREPDDLARSNAAYALGQVARNPDADCPSILAALKGRLLPNTEPDNTNVAGLSRSTVRQSAAYAILQLAMNHALAPSARAELSTLISVERDRYVIGMLVEAIAHHSADATVIRALAGQRWSQL